MPHLIVEYSANLDSVVDFQTVVEALRAAAAETGVFPLGGIRARAHRCTHVAMADGAPEHGFVDVTLRIGKGRDEAVRQRAGDYIFAALSKALDPAFAATTVALSFQLEELQGLSWKRNTVHDALDRA
ncbi:MAG: 5-carboxymethyl-2-hydroxymuconate isomerase [Stutzerimonas stutzeri]|jgi:5-carboxymethyl-2-hydroxymuconate isomerase|nr:MAG: 5-carboxymethyl-2-hydroxymuconate isomerase [Stutzerimonas stutzeri]